MSWQNRTTALHTDARKLKDGAMYVIGVFDLGTAGVLVRAYNQATSAQYTLGPSESELAAARLTRSSSDAARLCASIDIFELGNEIYIHSTLPGINKPKVIPKATEAQDVLKAMKIGSGVEFQELLTTGLCELCKVKPQGLDAVQWLGEWLLNNNPNQPSFEEPV